MTWMTTSGISSSIASIGNSVAGRKTKRLKCSASQGISGRQQGSPTSDGAGKRAGRRQLE